MELLLATLFLGTVLVAATSAIGSAAVYHTVRASQPMTAMDLAQEIHSASMLLSRSEGDGTAATVGSEVAVLDDLDGAVFTPPIDASLQSIAAMTGWSQQVGLADMQLAQPSLAAGEGAGADVLTELTVTVKHGGELAGTYTWWINP